MALFVAVGSSFLRRDREKEVVLLRQQVLQLHRDNQILGEKIRQVEGEYARSLALNRRLSQSLLEEQDRNQTLSEQLQQAGTGTAGQQSAASR